MPEKQFKQAQHQLDLMKTLVADLPGQEIKDHNELMTSESARRLTPAEGRAARAIRVLLFEKDPLRAFGDLRRIQAPSGEFIWVCPDHYQEYAPGPPSIPGN